MKACFFDGAFDFLSAKTLKMIADEKYNKIKQLRFCGKVVEIGYNDKKEVSVKIENLNYKIPFGYGHKFEIGDSIYKDKNSYLVRQYKNNVLIEEFIWGEELE